MDLHSASRESSCLQISLTQTLIPSKAALHRYSEVRQCNHRLRMNTLPGDRWMTLDRCHTGKHLHSSNGDLHVPAVTPMGITRGARCRHTCDLKWSEDTPTPLSDPIQAQSSIEGEVLRQCIQESTALHHYLGLTVLTCLSNVHLLAK